MVHIKKHLKKDNAYIHMFLMKGLYCCDNLKSCLKGNFESLKENNI